MRQPRHRAKPGKRKTGLSPETWEKIVRLLIGAIGPIAKLIDAISRLH